MNPARLNQFINHLCPLRRQYLTGLDLTGHQAVGTPWVLIFPIQPFKSSSQKFSQASCLSGGENHADKGTRS